MAAELQENQHVIKRIKFMDRENVPIFCQNLNGPCPLLALANVLALRNRLPVPQTSTSLSTSRLISMVAELILDADVPGVHEHKEYESHLRANISDSLNVLGKLAAGMDVNIRFDSPLGFEPTPEVAIFDLLGITLIHGWLVDPMDAPTTAALGSRSYNEVVEMVVNAADAAALAAASLHPQRGGENAAADAAAAAADIESASPAAPPAAASAVQASTGAEVAGGGLAARPASAGVATAPTVGLTDLGDLVADRGLEGVASAGGGTSRPAAAAPDLITFDDEEEGSSGCAGGQHVGLPCERNAGRASGSGADLVGELAGQGLLLREQGQQQAQEQAAEARGAAGELGPATPAAAGGAGAGGCAETAGAAATRLPGALAAAMAPTEGGAAEGGTTAEPTREEVSQQAAAAAEPVKEEEPAAAAAAAAAAGTCGGADDPPPSPPAPPPPSPPLPIPSYPTVPSASPPQHNTPTQPASGSSSSSPKGAGTPTPPPSGSPGAEAAAAGGQAGASGSEQEQVGAMAGASKSRLEQAEAMAGVGAQAGGTAGTGLAAETGKGAAGNSNDEAAAAVVAAGRAGDGLESFHYAGPDGAGTSAAYEVWQEAKRARAAALLKDAALARRFLEATASQLTEHGLVAIQATLSDNSLAVFFRNNHFSCMFKHEGALYLLVTDQGYMREGQVVWERLDSVNGNTQMCGPDFLPFRATEPPPRVDMAALSSLPPEALAGLSEADAAAIAEAAGAMPAGPGQGHHTSALVPVSTRDRADTVGDAELAALLAREEEEAAAAALRARQQQHHHHHHNQQQAPRLADASHPSVLSRLQQLRAQHAAQHAQEAPPLPVSTPSSILQQPLQQHAPLAYPQQPSQAPPHPHAPSAYQQQPQAHPGALPPPPLAATGPAPAPHPTAHPAGQPEFLPPAVVDAQRPQQLQYVPELDQYLLPGGQAPLQPAAQQQRQQPSLQPQRSSQADADADLALALHLQQQEEQEVLEAERRRQQEQQHQQQQHQHQQPAHTPLHPQHQLLQQQAARGRHTTPGGRRQPPPQPPPQPQQQPQPRQEDKACAVM